MNGCRGRAQPKAGGSPKQGVIADVREQTEQAMESMPASSTYFSVASLQVVP